MPIFYKENERVLFSHIPKTAGTSIYVWFADNAWVMTNHNLNPNCTTGKIFRSRFKITECKLEGPFEGNISPQHCTAETQKKWGEFSSRFCVVRHPYSRFISELSHDFKIMCYQKGVRVPTWDMAKAYTESMKSSIFRNYIKCPSIKNNHIRPQVDFISDIAHILHYEGDWQEWLKQKYSLQGWPPVVNKSRINISFSELIDDEFRQMIIDFYQKDFEKLNYPKDPEDMAVANLKVVNSKHVQNISKDDSNKMIKREAFWKTVLAPLPYAQSLFRLWQSNSTDPEYEQALDAYLYSMDATLPLSRRYALLKQSRDQLKALQSKDDRHTATTITLIRVLGNLGERELAASYAAQLLEERDQGKPIKMDLPFIPPLSDFDGRQVKGEIIEWVSVAIMEAFERLQADTSYHQPAKHLALLRQICKYPDCSVEMQRRMALIGLIKNGNVKIGDGSALLADNEENRNSWFWKKFVRKDNYGIPKMIRDDTPSLPNEESGKCNSLFNSRQMNASNSKWRKSIEALTLFAVRELRRNPLTLLADKYGSDKGFAKHLYTRVYGDKFSSIRNDIQSILEIGLLLRPAQKQFGKKPLVIVPSLDMWAEYFPNSKVYGFDIADFSAARGKWSKIIQGDQGKREDLAKITELERSFDIIIDDGLHASYHQQISFSFLFKYIKPGGIYIIEDLHAIPPEEKNNPIERTLQLLEGLKYRNTWNSPVSTENERLEIENNVGDIEFYDSMSWGVKGTKALAIIQKSNL